MDFEDQRKVFILAPEVPDIFQPGEGFCLSCTLTHCQDSGEALALLTEVRPDIAFVALEAEGNPPFELYQIIREMFEVHQVPVICFGHAPHDAMIAKVLEVGALSYFQLPLKMEMIKGCLLSWMRIAEQLRNTHQRLQDKDDLLMMVTHDLKNPLGRATFASSVLAEMPTIKREAYTHQLIQQVIYANEEISRLVKMLLSLSEMESEARLDLSVVDLRTLIERIVHNYQFLARLKEISIRTDVPDHMLLVEADPVWLDHAVGNLLSNAIKFTPDGGCVDVRLTESDIGVLIQIRDTGIGIQKKDLPHVFDKFYRSRRSELRQAEGNGLGLAIVKTAINRHGGQVLVDSREGEGSIFSIVLPPRTLCETPAFSPSSMSC